ncbi:MAG TPA: class I SAM-dependent methyltransferase [Pyrinomonadaceae bacterium]|jgi:ubiquinone/menaquinone biosynthesis C-methylase UbiE|nr:class I SAM-dependent methyltransferase [Pyrinomonadaceae bacterium]
MERKSDKELAFLHDLYIGTDWGERFAEMVDAHVELPKEGRALYLEAGSGSHALVLQERAGAKLTIVCADENEECLELARAKAAALHERAEFQRENPRALSFPQDQFDLVLANNSFTPPQHLRANLREVVRVVKPGALVAWWLPTASSFGEFFSIYWEALLNAGALDHGADVEHLISELPTISDAERWSQDAGLADVTSWTAIEEFDYASGAEFLNSPLITDFLLPVWLQSIPDDQQQKVRHELTRIIDEERHAGEFALTLKATLVLGKKGRVQ